MSSLASVKLRPMEIFDVAIVGGGPAGSSCAAFCALAGLHTLVLERERFPREKVCGDCINPSCWSVLERLALSPRVLDLPHSKLTSVEFIAIDGRKVTVDLPTGDNCEISVKRSLFDDLLLRRAREVGALVREETIVKALAHDGDWKIATATGGIFAPGFNSGRWTKFHRCTAAQFAAAPYARTSRIASAHPAAADFGKRIVLQFLREGYSGQAPVNKTSLIFASWECRRRFPDCGNGRKAISKSPPINPGAPSRRLSVRPFPAHMKIFFLSATPPASWSRLPAKEFIMHSARENSQQRRLRKS